MIYDVRHETRVHYPRPVADARFGLRLLPAEWPGQTVLKADLTIDPPAARRADHEGPYVVRTTRAEFDDPLVSLMVTSTFAIEIAPRDLSDSGPATRDLRRLAVASRDPGPMSPAPYLFASRIATGDRSIGAWAEEGFAPDRPILDTAMALSGRIHREFAYRPGVTDSDTAPHEAFVARQGVCQDFAHVLIIALRWLGIPAAYASGYLRTIPPPGRARLVGADQMHAWVNVWCGPELGWIGVDPTNDCLARQDHVQIAMGRDYADVSPIDGTFVGAASQTMRSAVDVVARGA